MTPALSLPGKPGDNFASFLSGAEKDSVNLIELVISANFGGEGFGVLHIVLFLFLFV